MIKFLIGLLLLIPFLTMGQGAGDEFQKKFKEADDLLNSEYYDAALPLFLDLYSQDSTNANLNFKIGLSYLNSTGHKVYAIKYLEKALPFASAEYNDNSLKETKAPEYTIRYLAEAYHLNYQFDNAISSFDKFKTITKDPEEIRFADREIQMCNNGKEFIQNPVNIKVTNLGPEINSRFADYAPVINGDETTLIFTSRRPGTGGKLTEDDKYFEDIYISTKTDSGWSSPVSIDPNINTEKHDANIGLSLDGQQLLLYRDDNGDGNIYMSLLIGDNWSPPAKFGSDINSKAWEPSACFSADGSTIYFVSDRKGGLGGRDIYRAKKLPSGEWSMAENLGAGINTEFDEDGPFIHPDGVTLYFSSNGHKTMGGFDIFKSTMSGEGKWAPPENLGYPINTTDDDIFYLPTADGKRAYYASFNEGGYGEKDLYLLELPELKEASLAVYRGEIHTKSGKVPSGVTITVINNNTGEVVGSYIPNAVTGKFLFILPPGGNYNITYEAEDYLIKSENIEVAEDVVYNVINRAIDLAPIEVGEKTVLKNIFFESGSSNLKKESFTELEKVLALLKDNPKIVVEISGHTDTSGPEEMNLKLSRSRAEIVVKWLVNKGVAKDRLVAHGYGETMPVVKDVNPDGTYIKEALDQNRRIEFKVLSK